MSYSDAVTRISQIQSQIQSLQGAFDPATAAATAQAVPTTTATTGTTVGGTTFASALDQAQGLAGAFSGGTTLGAGAPLSQKAASMMTPGQQQFASRLAAGTGLDSGVIAAWMLAEESGGAAQSRESAGNYDWLNIGYTDSGTYGAGASIWNDPITAADATAGWLKGQDTIPGYGRASSGIQAILNTAGQSPAAQIAALQQSGWASSGYPDLPSLYQQVSG